MCLDSIYYNYYVQTNISNSYNVMYLLNVGRLEQALSEYSTETILFDLLKFLLQAIFSAMEEEHENLLERCPSLATPTTTTPTSTVIEDNVQECGTTLSGNGGCG